MSLIFADRIKETTTTTGTGEYTLSGASTGFQTFLAGIGSGNRCHYCVTDNTDWEVGEGTVSGTTLFRSYILSSSNSDAEVNWGAGTKDAFCTIPGNVSGVRKVLGLGTDDTPTFSGVNFGREDWKIEEFGKNLRVQHLNGTVTTFGNTGDIVFASGAVRFRGDVGTHPNEMFPEFGGSFPQVEIGVTRGHPAVILQHDSWADQNTLWTLQNSGGTFSIHNASGIVENHLPPPITIDTGLNVSLGTYQSTGGRKVTVKTKLIIDGVVTSVDSDNDEVRLGIHSGDPAIVLFNADVVKPFIINYAADDRLDFSDNVGFSGDVLVKGDSTFLGDSIFLEGSLFKGDISYEETLTNQVHIGITNSHPTVILEDENNAWFISNSGGNLAVYNNSGVPSFEYRNEDTYGGQFIVRSSGGPNSPTGKVYIDSEVGDGLDGLGIHHSGIDLRLFSRSQSGGMVGTYSNDDFSIITNGTKKLGISTSGTLNGPVLASQSDMEGREGGKLVTPDKLHYHPGVAKGWVKIDSDASIVTSYNVSSISDNGAGDFNVNWDTDFSSANHISVATSQKDTDVYARITTTTNAAGVTRVQNRTVGSVPAGTDPDHTMVVAFGDQ